MMEYNDDVVSEIVHRFLEDISIYNDRIQEEIVSMIYFLSKTGINKKKQIKENKKGG